MLRKQSGAWSDLPSRPLRHDRQPWKQPKFILPWLAGQCSPRCRQTSHSLMSSYRRWTRREAHAQLSRRQNLRRFPCGRTSYFEGAWTIITRIILERVEVILEVIKVDLKSPRRSPGDISLFVWFIPSKFKRTPRRVSTSV